MADLQRMSIATKILMFFIFCFLSLPVSAGQESGHIEVQKSTSGIIFFSASPESHLQPHIPVTQAQEFFEVLEKQKPTPKNQFQTQAEYDALVGEAYQKIGEIDSSHLIVFRETLDFFADKNREIEGMSLDAQHIFLNMTAADFVARSDMEYVKKALDSLPENLEKRAVALNSLRDRQRVFSSEKFISNFFPKIKYDAEKQRYYTYIHRFIPLDIRAKSQGRSIRENLFGVKKISSSLSVEIYSLALKNYDQIDFDLEEIKKYDGEYANFFIPMEIKKAQSLEGKIGIIYLIKPTSP